MDKRQESHREHMAGERAKIREDVTTLLACVIDHDAKYLEESARLRAVLCERLGVQELDADLDDLIGDVASTAADAVAGAAYDEMFARMPLLHISAADRADYWKKRERRAA
jgi:hypothetical protein